MRSQWWPRVVCRTETTCTKKLKYLPGTKHNGMISKLYLLQYTETQSCNNTISITIKKNYYHQPQRQPWINLDLTASDFQDTTCSITMNLKRNPVKIVMVQINMTPDIHLNVLETQRLFMEKAFEQIPRTQPYSCWAQKLFELLK